MIFIREVSEVEVDKPKIADVQASWGPVLLRIHDHDGGRIYITCINSEAAHAAADAINLAIGAKL
jgi:hypothetical protein